MIHWRGIHSLNFCWKYTVRMWKMFVREVGNYPSTKLNLLPFERRRDFKIWYMIFVLWQLDTLGEYLSEKRPEHLDTAGYLSATYWLRKVSLPGVSSVSSEKFSTSKWAQLTHLCINDNKVWLHCDQIAGTSPKISLIYKNHAFSTDKKGFWDILCLNLQSNPVNKTKVCLKRGCWDGLLCAKTSGEQPHIMLLK